MRICLQGCLGFIPSQLILAETNVYEAKLRAEPKGSDASNFLESGESQQPHHTTSYHLGMSFLK